MKESEKCKTIIDKRKVSQISSCKFPANIDAAMQRLPTSCGLFINQFWIPLIKIQRVFDCSSESNCTFINLIEKVLLLFFLYNHPKLKIKAQKIHIIEIYHISHPIHLKEEYIS